MRADARPGARRRPAVEAPGGGLDQLRAEIAAGRAGFAGISSHHPEVLQAALDSGRCDVVLFPIGPFVDRRYETEILPLAKARGVGTVCFKTFGAGKLLGDTEGYSRPLQGRPRGKVSSGGLEDTAFEPLFEAQLADVRRRAEESIRGKGRCWWNPEPSPR